MSRPNFTKRTGIVPKIKAVDVDFLTDTRLSGSLIFKDRLIFHSSFDSLAGASPSPDS